MANFIKNLIFADNEETPPNEVNKDIISKPSTPLTGTLTPEIVTPTPETTDIFETSTISNDLSSENPFLDILRQTFLHKFEELNKDGVDFFEFYKSIVDDGNINQLPLYPMAFKMLASLNKSGNPLTKESILNDGDFYLKSLEKVFEDTNVEATQRKTQLQDKIDELENKIKLIKDEMEGNRKKLNEIDLKLSAGKIAKNELIANIKLVMSNIINTIK